MTKFISIPGMGKKHKGMSAWFAPTIIDTKLMRSRIRLCYVADNFSQLDLKVSGCGVTERTAMLARQGRFWQFKFRYLELLGTSSFGKASVKLEIKLWQLIKSILARLQFHGDVPIFDSVEIQTFCSNSGNGATLYKLMPTLGVLAPVRTTTRARRSV
ncbi:hypothetical protein C5167_029388 [Papaver somniferum]|nr:hypothetical protein C5167_029388 [Papaver somniferum]